MEDKDKNTTEKSQEENYIELNTFLKINGIASTGGQAKNIIRDGQVIVNGNPETRNKKKLHAGDVVAYDGKKYTVKL